jgi:hypothetical protein
MTPRTARPWLALIAALACGPTKPGESETGTGSTTATTAASTDTPTTSTAATTTADPTNSDGSGGATDSATDSATSSTTDVPTGPVTMTTPAVCPDIPPDTAEMCAAQTDRASCNGLDLGDVGSCYWVAWTPVRLIDGECSFGDPRGACLFRPCVIGDCATPGILCSPSGGPGGFIPNDQGVSIGLGDWCDAPPDPAMSCEVDEQGMVLQGAPECACLCKLG